MFNNWWLEDAPKNWKVVKFKHVFEFQSNVSFNPEPVVLSLTLKGLVVRDISSNEGQLAESYQNYALVKPGDFVLNPMDLVSGSVAISQHEGVVSNAYFVFRVRESRASEIEPRFMELYFFIGYKRNILFPFGKGLGRPEQGGGRWTLNRETLSDFPILIPPIEEQRRLVGLVDSQLALIDEQLGVLSQLEVQLKEQRNAAIAAAVLNGGN
jgi:type I restriction enzyme S subunit